MGKRVVDATIFSKSNAKPKKKSDEREGLPGGARYPYKGGRGGPPL